MFVQIDQIIVVFFDLYLQAAHHLYENEAKYPKRITYHNPPELSLEALEVRINAIGNTAMFTSQ